MKAALVAIGFALLFTACRVPAHVTVTTPTTLPASVTDTRPDARFKGFLVDTVGGDTVITWLGSGRRVVLRDMVGYTGVVSLTSAHLTIGDTRVSADENWFLLWHPTYSLETLLADCGNADLLVEDGVLTLSNQ